MLIANMLKKKLTLTVKWFSFPVTLNYYVNSTVIMNYAYSKAK